MSAINSGWCFAQRPTRNLQRMAVPALAIRFETARLHPDVRFMPNKHETSLSTNERDRVTELCVGIFPPMLQVINLVQWCKRQLTVLTPVARPMDHVPGPPWSRIQVDIAARLYRELV